MSTIPPTTPPTGRAHSGEPIGEEVGGSEPELNIAAHPKTCNGRGYFLVAADPYYWDVDTVRVDCKGCSDCVTFSPVPVVAEAEFDTFHGEAVMAGFPVSPWCIRFEDEHRDEEE